ncbi:hypothetical protein FA95DRAFT_1599352 [Auriscalpium vulgare]|uniref:Uncharacterized protein n=1 Tax=Auriscalpium vulgare TaxID=40419 RepID=A0ACB8RAI8_9AGAM|nr:hypothetical protein FA95DRAFT_1599352 [Auriscalpium vulgare]
MGVSGLWDILHSAGQSRALTNIAAVDGFEANTSGRRGYRVGIDASLWYTHTMGSKGGENPELRMLFFRVRALAAMPLLPLFVFDGRERPKMKRGSKMGKSGSHTLTAGLKRMIELFGMEWRMAIGEAEAELAYLNRIGLIDAVLTDDVDALIFGATTLIRNSSLGLTGNKSNPARDSSGQPSKFHCMVYTADRIKNHADVQLTRGGLILIALLAGGDYHAGLKGFGPLVGHGLARCGFGNTLLDIYGRREEQDIRPLLSQWRDSVRDELRSNSKGFLSKRHPSLALPPNFPPMEVLENYLFPKTSEASGGRSSGVRDNAEMSLPRLAAFCETHFSEWGYEAAILKRFRSLMWVAAIMRVLRRAALETDEKEKDRRHTAGVENWSTIRGLLRPAPADAVGIPDTYLEKFLNMQSVDRYRDAFVNQGPQAPGPRIKDRNPLNMKIVSSRRHVSTDYLPEYRVEFNPSRLVALTRTGIKGKHAAPTGTQEEDDDDDPLGVDFTKGFKKSGAQREPKETVDPDTVMREWLPALMMDQVFPGLVLEFRAKEEAKKTKTKGKGKAKAKTQPRGAGDQSNDDVDDGYGDGMHAEPRTPRASHTAHNHSARTPSSSAAESSTIATPIASQPMLSPWDAEQLYGPRGWRSGFYFTFPNPDDPDMILPEDAVDMSGASLSTPSASSLLPRSTLPAKTSSQPQAARRRHSSPAPGPDPPRDAFDPIFDRIMGLDPAGRRASQPASTRTRRPRAGAPAASQRGGRARPQRPHALDDVDAAMLGFGMGDDDELPIGPPPRNQSRASEALFDGLFDQVMGGSSGRRRAAPARRARGARGGRGGRGTRAPRLTREDSDLGAGSALGLGADVRDDEDTPIGPPPAGQSAATARMYDALFEQTAGGSSASQRPKLKPRPLKRRVQLPESETSSAHIPSSSPARTLTPRLSSPPLAAIEFERPRKRARVSAPATAAFPALPALDSPTRAHRSVPRQPPQPVLRTDSKGIIEILTDSEDEGQHASSSRMPVFSRARGSGGVGRHAYPEASSSQDSGLLDLSDVSVFVDLT